MNFLTYENPELIQAIVKSVRQFIQPDEKVIWREPHRWHDDNGIIPNAYEMFSIQNICNDLGLELVHDFTHVAVVKDKYIEPIKDINIEEERNKISLLEMILQKRCTMPELVAAAFYKLKLSEDVVRNYLQNFLEAGPAKLDEKMRLYVPDEHIEKRMGLLHKNTRFLTASDITMLAIWGNKLPEPEDNQDVHTEHCCIKHGCKYHDDYCTVLSKKKVQSYTCETCNFDYEEY